jgi:hypothetical protein
MLDRIPKAVWFAAGLGILIGFSGLVGWSSAQPPHHQTVKNAAHATENKTTQDISAEIVAYYTKVLAWFTAILAFASMGQGLMLLRADKVTRRAADAAKEAAEHIPKVERAYLSGGGIGSFRSVTGGGSTPRVGLGPFFALQVNNFGKTPGEIRKVRYGFLPAPADDNCLDAPVPPRYSEILYWQDWYRSGQQSRDITDLEIPAKITYPTVIFGRLYYRDIFKSSHSSGFALKIGAQGGSSPVRIPESYTEERDEADAAAT